MESDLQLVGILTEQVFHQLLFEHLQLCRSKQSLSQGLCCQPKHVEPAQGDVIHIPKQTNIKLWKGPLSTEWHSHCCFVAKSCPTLLRPPWTVAHQVPLSMGFPRQEYQSGLPFPPPGDLPNPGIELKSPALDVGSLPSEPPGKQHSH